MGRIVWRHVFPPQGFAASVAYQLHQIVDPLLVIAADFDKALAYLAELRRDFGALDRIHHIDPSRTEVVPGLLLQTDEDNLKQGT